MNNSSVRHFSFSLAIMALASIVVGCGVRGRPQPPLTPPALGRGEATFQKATPEFAFPSVPSPQTTPTPDSTPARKTKKRGAGN